jgi:hypothetical protein
MALESARLPEEKNDSRYVRNQRFEDERGDLERKKNKRRRLTVDSTEFDESTSSYDPIIFASIDRLMIVRHGLCKTINR